MKNIDFKKNYKIPGFFLDAICNMVIDINSGETDAALVLLGQLYNELCAKEFEEID